MKKHLHVFLVAFLLGISAVGVGACSDDGRAHPGAQDAADATEETVQLSDTGFTDVNTVHSDNTDSDTTDSDTTDTRQEPGPGSWRLPQDYFISAKMPMTVVHPRDGEAPQWVFAKNAYPGVRWEIPIVIQGGAWPFQYVIVDNGGAEGLAIGGELQREEVDGFVVHSVPDEYGRLWWDDPREGIYDILLRVNDQDGNSVDVPISLTVGTAGWIFVDADDGDDANAGTLDAPFKTIERIHEGGEMFANHRVYLSGVVPMDGNRDNGNFRIASDATAPSVWVGKPGGAAVLEAYEGKIVLDSPDFYLANLEYRHKEDFFQMDDTYLHMITVWGDTDRYTVHDVDFTRFQGVGTNTSLGNSSIMMLTKNDSGRNYVAVVNNTLSGDNGILTSSYQLRYAVFEKNRAVGADFKVADGSVWSQIYIKGGTNENVTLRANEFWDNNLWTNRKSALGVLQARNIELAYNTIDTPYDSGRTGALTLWTNSPQASFGWTEETPVWLYRNSLKRRVKYEGDALANMPDGTVIMERNVLDTGAWPESARIINVENLEEDSFFDPQMRLTGSARTDHLGRYGAEIGVVAE